MAFRNNTWHQRLTPYFKDNFIFVYAGVGHIDRNGRGGSLTDRLKDNKLNTTAVSLFHRDFLSKEAGERLPLKEFIITIPAEYKDSIGCDYVLLYH
jgi:hypothetical protein